jgi:hypothetical protein
MEATSDNSSLMIKALLQLQSLVCGLICSAILLCSFDSLLNCVFITCFSCCSASRSAVLAALDITRIVQSRLQVSLRLGIATGTAFCGNIGSNQRCEYVLIGSSVNSAARLMNVACNLGFSIICDRWTMLASTLTLLLCIFPLPKLRKVVVVGCVLYLCFQTVLHPHLQSTKSLFTSKSSHPLR